MVNPYLPPGSTAADEESKRKHWRATYSFIILSSVLCLTLAFALVNAIEEELGALRFTAMVTLLAGISQLPGIAIATLRGSNGSWGKSSTSTALLTCAYVIAATGLAVYAVYAFDGKADSMNSAAHLHIFVFPIMHCIFGIAVYGLGSATSLIVYFVRSVVGKGRDV